MQVTRNIKVSTVQYGFALEIDGKQWLLEDEQHLAEAIVFRVLIGCKKPTSRKHMRWLLSLAAYGFKGNTVLSNTRSDGRRQYKRTTKSRRYDNNK